MAGLILPPAEWRTRPGLARLVAALGPGTARIVGGAVRDTLLGLGTSDIDLATAHAPTKTVDLLAAARIKAVPTGIAHGTITAVADGEVYEVTTLRRDVATDGRHATVVFTDDWREDAARRDFTINALYADPADGAVDDYFGGLDDLAARRVRFIGDPLQRIAEDHLRILRFFRFHARFGALPDADALAACTARANDLMALSRERIAAELLKLLVAEHAAPTLRLMVTGGILAPVLPEIDASSVARLERLAQREAAVGIAPDPVRRLSALLPRGAAEEVGARLKLSKLQRRRLERDAVPIGAEGAFALGYLLGAELAVDLLLLSDRPTAEVAPEVATLLHWTAPKLPLTGGDIVARGVGRGPDVARLLRQIEQRWIDEGFPSPDRVVDLADAAVDQWRRASIT